MNFASENDEFCITNVDFCITNETQVHFFSLSFAGERWGGSICVPPWIDATRGENWSPQILDQQEGTLCLKLDPSDPGGAAEISAKVRTEFSFKADAFFPPPEPGAGR